MLSSTDWTRPGAVSLAEPETAVSEVTRPPLAGVVTDDAAATLATVDTCPVNPTAAVALPVVPAIPGALVLRFRPMVPPPAPGVTVPGLPPRRALTPVWT